MKRICALLLAISCCLVLFGCKKKAKPTTAPTQTSAQAATQVPAEAPTETPTQAPTGEPTQAPVEEPIQAPTEESTQAPTETPTQVPTEAPAAEATKSPTRKPITVVAPTKAPATAPATAPTTVPTTADAEVPTQAPTEAPHQHTFGEWGLEMASTCTREGREDRQCAQCGYTESRSVAKADHRYDSFNVCWTCGYVEFEENGDIVELGIPTAAGYDAGAVANCAWDLKLWNGKLYRGAGDYDKNSGRTDIWAYDTESHRWQNTFETSEEAIHRFVEIDGKLYTPGVDPTEDWVLGNYYVLNGESWTKLRNLPNGIHNYDMVEFDGKIFAGLGVSAPNSPVVMSTDKGKTYSFVPLYKDGKQVDTTGLTYIRVYEYMIFNDQLYAYVMLDSDKAIYRFEEDKMVWVGQTKGYVYNKRTNINYFNAKFQLGDIFFFVSNHLIGVRDFADPSTAGRTVMPQNEYVNDALLADGLLYVLAYRQKDDGTYQTVIYSSRTGLTDSFTEVLQFDYPVPPTCFTFDGDFFYIGMGSKSAVHEKNGMLLRVKPQ